MIAVLLLVLAQSEADVQGLYEGMIQGAPVEARVVATGKLTYKVFVRRDAAKSELEGKTDGEAVSFKGGGVSAVYKDGAIQGDGVDLKKVRRTPPTLGKAPPEGAIVLLDGKNFDEMTKGKGDEDWKAEADGSIQVPKGGMNSKRQFDGSYDLHVEFLCPLMPAARGQGRGNSGCYQINGDEVQVLDSFGMDTYKGGGCGGLYQYKDPDAFDVFSLASLPPLEWQAYDIAYRAEKKDGKPSGKPRITVLHNGIKIHDNAELKNDAKKGGLHWQDHGNPVRYRNIWILPLGEK